MTTPLQLMRRVLDVVLALFVASGAAGLALSLGLALTSIRDAKLGDLFDVGAVIVLLGGYLSIYIFVLIGLPALALVGAAEMLRVRSVAAYVLAGVGCGALAGIIANLRTHFVSVPSTSIAIAMAGAIGGLAYWFLAGRKAGSWRQT